MLFVYSLFFPLIGEAHAMGVDSQPLLDRIDKSKDMINYFKDQVKETKELQDDANNAFASQGIVSDFQGINEAYNQSVSNLKAEERLLEMLEKKLANGDTSPELSTTSSLGKRKADFSNFETSKK